MDEVAVSADGLTRRGQATDPSYSELLAGVRGVEFGAKKSRRGAPLLFFWKIPGTIRRAGTPLDRLHWLHGEATERSGDRESIRRCLRGYSDYWSARVSRNIRVVGKRSGDTVEWAWIGTHNQFDKLFR